MTQRNSIERQKMLTDRARDQRNRVGGFTQVPGKRSLSTRGERTESWRTKRWTPARWAELNELETPNSALCEALDYDAGVRRRRIDAHLARNPTDTSALAALRRITS